MFENSKNIDWEELNRSNIEESSLNNMCSWGEYN